MQPAATAPENYLRRVLSRLLASGSGEKVLENIYRPDHKERTVGRQDRKYSNVLPPGSDTAGCMSSMQSQGFINEHGGKYFQYQIGCDISIHFEIPRRDYGDRITPILPDEDADLSFPIPYSCPA